MFVIIKNGEIVKSKSSKTNQGPHLVLIYYKLIFMVSDGRIVSDGKENVQTEAAEESYRLIIQSDAVKTECALYRLKLVVYRSDAIRRRRNKERKIT